MRLVTWNINGLASLSFPFHINAHHTHRYPTVAASTAAVPADEYEYDETALTDCPASTAASPPSALPRDVSDAGGLTAAASEAATSPHDPSFPAFPARRIPLTDVLVASHDELIGYFQADVVCLQEVKIGRARMDLLAKAAFAAGYDSFFSFCRKRPGYSGVATFTRAGSMCPVAAEEGVTGTWPALSAVCPSSAPSSGIGHNSALLSCTSAAELRELDSEGRCVITDHGAFLLFNVYVPNAGEQRNDFKLRFLELLSLRLRQCQAEGREVVVVGDLNIAATRLDHCAPEPFEMDDGSKLSFEESPSRQWWRSNVTDSLHAATEDERLAAACVDQHARLVDVLRAEFPQQRMAYTCWNTLTGARAGNYGSRIDYILASPHVAAASHSSRILAHVQGSDHCPVQCEVDVQRLSGWRVGSVPPALCSQWWPELSGQQKKLSSFFVKLDPASLEQQQQQQQQALQTAERAAAALKPASVGSKRARAASKRPSGESVKLSQKKRKLLSASNSQSASVSASLLSYFSSPAPLTPPTPPVADIDRAFQTDGARGQQQQQQRGTAAATSPARPLPAQPRAAGRLTGNDNSPHSRRSLASVDTANEDDDDEKEALLLVDEEEEQAEALSPLSPSTAVTPPPTVPSSSPRSSLSASTAASFSRLFTQSSLAVLCEHGLPAKMWQVNKKGLNHGRQFYCCNVPPPGRCGFWSWLSDLKRERSKQQQRQQQQQQQQQQQMRQSSEQPMGRAVMGEFVSARRVQAQITGA